MLAGLLFRFDYPLCRIRTDTLQSAAPLISSLLLDLVNKDISESAISASVKPIITLDNIRLIILPKTISLIPFPTPVPMLHLIIVLPTLIVLLRSATSLQELRDLLPFINPSPTRHGNTAQSNRFLKKTKMTDQVDLNRLLPAREMRTTTKNRREEEGVRLVR